MGVTHGASWRKVGVAAFVLILILALWAPVAASAAAAASFSSKTPASGSSTSKTRPTIACSVYDSAGIHGSGSVVMTVDGQSVTPARSYTVSGVFDPANPDYRRLKLSYTPGVALAAGSHTVYLKVSDQRGRSSSTTWSFTVTGPEPPYSATFSGAKPGSGATFYGPRPSVSVGVSDKYGIKGSGTYALSIDGTAIGTSVKYAKSGVYTGLTLSGTAPTLANGAHTATAKVTDLHKHVSTYSWSFTVAPYRASFSGFAPGTGALVQTATSTVSVHVDDTFGVKGSGSYALSLDGQALTSGVAYTSSGDYTSLTLSAPVTALVDGTHTVTASVTDLSNITSTVSWSFVVKRPLLEMPVTIQSSSCTSCHAGYPGTHPMTNCQACHGPGRPVPGVIFTPASLSAHTLSCAVMVCHRGPGYAFPHVLSSDCASCHTGQFSGIPVAHGEITTATHLSSNTFCTREGCHARSLTVEHYRYMKDGAALSCATCHASTDAAVMAAIAAKSSDCVSCHGAAFTTTPHVGTAVAHQNPGISCNQAGCHDKDLPGIHKGACAPCHASGVTATADCLSCHSVDIHASVVDKHTAPAQTCTAAACHGTNGMAIHLPRGALACASCHGVGMTPTLICTTCHTKTFDELHAAGATHHVAQSECTRGGCHATGDTTATGDASATADVTAIHSAGTNPPGCAACHAAGKTPSVACLDCHERHTSISQHQVTGACASCHGTDVSVIHTTGTNPPGCAACHASGKTPSLVCATCHTTLSSAHTTHLSTSASRVMTIAGVAYGVHACSECHTSMDLQVVHPACATCHPKPADSAAKMSFSCVQGLCHTAASTAPVHAGIDATHVPDASANGCKGAGCHGDLTSVVVPHMVSGGPGCAACHNNPSHPISRTCSNCHAGHNLPALHAASPVSVPTVQIGSATYALPACSTCHASDLRDIHSATGCATCHATSVSSLLGGAWAKGCVQGGCHTASSTAPMHGSVSAVHMIGTPPSAFTSCLVAGCHPATDLAALHAGKLGCATCHGGGKTPTRDCSALGCHKSGAPATHGSHVATDGAAAFQINGRSYPGTIACSNCHTSLDLQVVHGANSCLKCHPDPATSHDPGTFACVNGGCHTGAGTATMKPYHGVIGTAHALPVALPNGWTCTAAGCHPARDVAELHSTTPGGCTTCHGFGKSPTKDCTSSGCHDGTTVIPPAAHTSHESTVTSASISINNTDYGTHDCSECHSSDLQVIHVATGCATCHPTPAQGLASFDCQQSGCHDQSAARPMHGSIDTTHAIVLPAGWGCTSGTACHSGGDLAALHSNASTTTAGVTRRSCQLCHTTVDTPATGDCTRCHTDVTDGLPTTHRSKHDVTVEVGCTGGAGCHATSGNLTDIHAALGCAVCHAPAANSVIPTSTLAAAITNYASIKATTPCSVCHTQAHAASHQWCTNCHSYAATAPYTDHNPSPQPDQSCQSCHTANFQALSGPAWIASGDNNLHCGGVCHGNTVPAPSADLHYVDATQGACIGSGCHANNLTIIHKAGCATCHAPTSTTIPAATIAAAIANQDKRCATCHTGGLPANHTSHQSTQTTGTVVEGGATYQITCANCHASMELQTVHGGTSSCAKCHPTPATGLTSFQCDQQGCHSKTGTLQGAARAQHASIDASHAASLPTGWTCTQSGCHDGGLTGTDVAAIHSKPTGGGCICHDGIHPLRTQCATSGCHEKFSNDHVATHTSCNSCHSQLFHGAGPVIGSTTNVWWSYVNRCAYCHMQGTTWSHPDEGCHGCDDPSGMSWNVSW